MNQAAKHFASDAEYNKTPVLSKSLLLYCIIQGPYRRHLTTKYIIILLHVISKSSNPPFSFAFKSKEIYIRTWMNVKWGGAGKVIIMDKYSAIQS